MEPNRFNCFWENDEKPDFDPRLTPFCPISGEPEFSWTCRLVHICTTIISSFCRTKSKIVRAVFEKMPKNPFFDPLFPNFSTPGFYFKNRALLLFSCCRYLTLCQVSRKSFEPFFLTLGPDQLFFAFLTPLKWRTVACWSTKSPLQWKKLK